MTNRRYYFHFLAIMFTVVLVTPIVTLRFKPSPILVEGRLTLGQAESTVETILLELGYTPSASPESPSEVEKGARIFAREDSNLDHSPLLRLKYSRGYLTEINGRMQFLEYMGKEVRSGTSRKYTESVLGSPDSQQDMGKGTLGLTFDEHSLYLIFNEGKLQGFALRRSLY